MWWLLLLAAVAGGGSSTSSPESKLPPMPDDEDELPPVSDAVVPPPACRWRIVADGVTASLCGEAGAWRAVFVDGDEGRRYTLPEHALTRIASRLKLAGANVVEIEGARFHATTRRRAGKYEWTVIAERFGSLPDRVERGTVATLLDALGEIWTHTGAP